MLKASQVIKVIEDFAPLSIQGDFDNCGLKTGYADTLVSGILITLDTNEEIVKEAIAKKCNFILEHHPSIFYPIKKLDFDLPLIRAISLAIKNDIVIYSAHTNVDFAENGLNDYFAKKIGLNKIYSLSSDGARMGTLNEETTLSEFADRLRDILKDNSIRTVGSLNKKINKVAVINGGGGSSSEELISTFRQGCDIFVSGDVKYAVSRLAKDLDYGIIEIGHYTSEQGFLPLMYSVLKEKLETNIYLAEKQTNPYN